MEIHREEDGEFLGVVVPEGNAYRPTTVFGAPLAAPQPTAEEAEDIIRQEAMPSLAETWWLNDTPVRIQEARPNRVRVQRTDPEATHSPHGEWVDGHTLSRTRP